MPTSSITKNFIISGKENVEAFADAIEAAFNDKTPVKKVTARVLSDPEEIKAFMMKCEEKEGVSPANGGLCTKVQPKC